MDEMLTPTDIQKHLKIGRNKTYQLIQLSSFPKIKIGNTYRIPKEKYLKWISDNIRKTIFFIVKKWELYRNDITPLFLIK